MKKKDLAYLKELAETYLKEWAIDYSKEELEDTIAYLRQAYNRGKGVRR